MIYGACFLLLLVNFAQSQKVDGGWSQWSAVDCTKGCGNRFEHSTRKCNNPAPQNGGRLCKGQPLRSVYCYGPKPCQSSTSLPLTTDAGTPPPPVDGGWSQWSAVDCTKGCGNPSLSTRKCNNPAPQNGGRRCKGQPLRSHWCLLRKPCPTTTSLPLTTDAGTPPLPATTKSPSPPLPPAACGKVHVKTSKVIGGVDAVPGAWPWQVALLYSNSFMCGGSLINEQWVVTAAHCVYRRHATMYKIATGEHDRRVNEGRESQYEVEAIYVHEKYGRPSRLNNDIALMKLKTPVKMGQYVSPVCLPDAPPAVGTECYITGWGKIRHPGGSHWVLQQAPMKVVDHQTCYDLNTVKSRSLPVTNKMICAGNGAGTITSGCHGDSGGPFVCKAGDGRWELQGAVSWGNPRCDVSKAYTAFARITEFKTWIADKINKN